jgi:TatD DNase family protein
MQFFDSHCHFDFAEFNVDRAAHWLACNQQGIAKLLMPGVAPTQWSRAAQLCEQYQGLCYAAGIHPHWIEQQQWFQKNAQGLLDEPTQAKIIALIGDENVQAQKNGSSHCVAIGECGLDKRIATPLTLQQQLLEIHIEIANQLQRPLIIHCVHAHNELIAQLRKHKNNCGGVIHAFTGSYETACQYIEMGFYLGVGGAITYERAHKTRTAVAKAPLEFILLETDAPDMPLQGKQGQRNSPENIPLIAQVLAELRSVSCDEIAAATWRNTQALFCSQ